MVNPVRGHRRLERDLWNMLIGRLPSRRVRRFWLHRTLGDMGDGAFVGMTGFGASAPYQELYEKFGITAEAVAAAAQEKLAATT